MTVVYILAHFDDEYCALPLIRRDLAAGRDLRFIHLVDYRDPRMGRSRREETLALLAGLGVDAGAETDLGDGTGWFDGELHRHVRPAMEALRGAVASLASVERLVTLAWEGGHPDHDVTAALAARLGDELGVRVDQFGLYQGKGLPWLLFQACRPLRENGPVEAIPLTLAESLDWARRIRAFPSQLRAWSGLAPAMLVTFARQRAFRYQRLAPGRTAERPHAGTLLYERMFKTPYATVRAAVDALNAPSGPA